MGLSMSLNSGNDPESEDYFSDSEIEDEPHCIPSPNLTKHSENESNNVSMDSATDSVQITKPTTVTIKLSLENVREIESDLDRYEIISLVFLLHDDNDVTNALEEMKSINESVILRWFKKLSVNVNQIALSEKLVEALCIIKNYEVLKRFDLEKDDMNTRFSPNYSFVSIHINKFRKLLYIICEELTISEAEKFVQLVKQDFSQKQILFKEYSSGTPLERYFLHWEKIGYIKRNDLSNIRPFLKQLGHMDLVEKTVSYDEGTKQTSNNNEHSKMQMEKIFSDSTSLHDFIQFADNASSKAQLENYDIDKYNPGVCLIINQEQFYREKDPKYKHLLPKTSDPLETRDGTQKDRDELQKTFNDFGFRTIVADNLTHLELIERIKQTTMEIHNQSSLFVCIMSHGEKGAVYGANSCKVNVEEIEKIMCLSNYQYLTGKPKVLILQSCQTVPVDKTGQDLQFDGPNPSPTVAASADFLILWATVPGHKAIRHKRDGSWLIQIFCQNIRKYADQLDLEKICTIVANEIVKKEVTKDNEKYMMVPIRDTTFTKQFFLPVPR